jgi:hypothetical protein
MSASLDRREKAVQRPRWRCRVGAMSKVDTQTHHLTPRGWIRDDENTPADRVMTITFYEPMKMHQTGYWGGNSWVSSDAEAVAALTKKFGRKPR